MAYQLMVTSRAVAGGSTRYRALAGKYHANATAAKVTGAAMAPPRSA
jgi:hypothetical protein